MKVLILTTGYPRWKDDFANIYLHRLARSLVSLNVKVHVLAPHASGLKKKEVMDGVYIHRFQYLYPDNLQTFAYFPGIPEKIRTWKGKIQLPLFFLSAAWSMLRLVQKEKIDCINAHWATPFGFLAVISKFIHKKPVIITLYGGELFPIVERKMTFLKPLTAYAIKHADTIVGISDTTCKAGVNISGRKDIEILPDGIDTETYNPKINGDEIKKKYGRFIFSSGRMVERKGFIYLIRAMPDILKQFPQIKLIISGDGPKKIALIKEVDKLNIKGKIIFPGFISQRNFSKYMKAADVFILPAVVDKNGDTEGSATILLEAMACETPVVSTKVGGIPFAIKNGIGGYMVEPKKPKQLAKKVLTLLTNKGLREKMGKIGQRYVEEKFNYQKTTQMYINKFKSLVTEKTR